MTRMLLNLMPALFLLALSPVVAALDTNRADVRAFVDQLTKQHGFERSFVQDALSQGQTQQSILDAISRPAEKTKPWHEYRDIFITRKRINAGVKFWNEQEMRLCRIADETGVPAEIIAAIVGVETYYGRTTGRYRVLDALTTLGFDYPKRGKFFRGELENLFLLAREEQLDLGEIKGSYAGAMGPPQFIPSSYRNYAVDEDGDGRRDLLNNWDDILASIANYFVAHRWRNGEPIVARGEWNGKKKQPASKNQLKLSATVGTLDKRGVSIDLPLAESTPAELISLEGKDQQELWVGFHNFYVITRYNRSVMYALAVHQLGQEIALEVKPGES